MSEINKIIVDCEDNDIIDIKCGGPRFLGYDFFVNSEEVDEIISFIKEELKKNEQPLIRIFHVKETNLSVELWTKEKISKCIKDGYN